VEGQQQGEAEYAFLLQSILICCSKPGIMQHRHVANQLFISYILLKADPANEGPVRIQYKCLVPIYLFPEMKLCKCSLVIPKTEL
jgi:hypothetical protein